MDTRGNNNSHHEGYKILPQQQLLSECVEQLQSTFKPEFKAIKARIQDLISKEYLERDNENSNSLRYIA